MRNFDHVAKKILGDPSERESLTARRMSQPFKTLNIEANGDVTTFYAGLTSQDYRSIYGDLDNGARCHREPSEAIPGRYRHVSQAASDRRTISRS